MRRGRGLTTGTESKTNGGTTVGTSTRTPLGDRGTAVSSGERSDRRVIQVHFASRPRGTGFKTTRLGLRSRAIGVAAAGLPLAAAFTVGAPSSTVHAATGTIVSPTYVRTIG